MPDTTVIHVRDMQPGDVYIGRTMLSRPDLKGGGWHNPVKIDEAAGVTREVAIARYEVLIRKAIAVSPRLFDIERLRGHRLACWCKPLPCHGDVLVKILNERSPS